MTVTEYVIQVVEFTGSVREATKYFTFGDSAYNMSQLDSVCNKSGVYISRSLYRLINRRYRESHSHDLVNDTRYVDKVCKGCGCTYKDDPDSGKYCSQSCKNRGKKKSSKRRLVYISGSVRDRLYAKFDYRCAYCGFRLKLTLDHVVPVSKGGRDIESNLVPACQSCNSSKGAKDVDEWTMSRSRKRIPTRLTDHTRM